MFLGLDFGLIIGVFAGLLTFIPYLGAILGGVSQSGFLWFNSGVNGIPSYS